MFVKIKKIFIVTLSVIFLTLCFSSGVTAAKFSVGTVSKLKATTKTTSVTLSWKKAKNAKGYKIMEKKNGKWKTVVTTTSTTCILTGLSVGSKHTYAVKAYGKKSGKKVWAKKQKTITVVTQPKKVTGLKATVTSKTAILKWKKAKGATGYRIYQYSSSKKKWVSLKKTTSLKTTIKELKPGKKYTFAVRSYTTKSKKTTYTGTYTKVTVITPPSNPSSLKVTETSTDSVTLSWSKASGASAYRIYRYDSSAKKWVTVISSTTARTATVSKLNPKTKYTFAVKAIAKSGSKTATSSKYVKASATTKKSLTVPTTKAEVAAAYNKVINAYRTYTGMVTTSKVETVNIVLTDVSAPAFVSVLNTVFNSLTGTTTNTWIFTNGVASTGEKTADRIIPLGRAANVKAEGLESTTVITNADGGYTMKLVFVEEKSVFDGTAETVRPTYHLGAADPFNFTNIEFGPIKYTEGTFNYPYTVIKATVDFKGRLVELYSNIPSTANCVFNMMSMSFETGLEVGNEVTWKMNYNSTVAPIITVPNHYPTTTAPTTTASTPKTTAAAPDNTKDGAETTVNKNIEAVPLNVNSISYGNRILYVEVDPSNWSSGFSAATKDINVKVDGVKLDTTVSCKVPSKKTGDNYEIKIDLSSLKLQSGALIDFTIPEGIVQSSSGTQYNESLPVQYTVD